MSTIRPRPLTCPLCATAFSGWLVLASNSHGPRSSDLRRFAEGEDPLPKQLNSCPHCGWLGEVSDFEEFAPKASEPVPAARVGAYYDEDVWLDAHDPLLVDRAAALPSTVGAQVTAFLTPRAAQAGEDPAFRYEQSAQVLRWRAAGPLREGDAFLRAAWLHEDEGRAVQGRRCRRRALGCYRRGVEERRWFKRRDDLVVVAYLTGELHRRLGEIEEGRRWFEQAVAWSSGLTHLQDLVELAERQGRDPRDLA